MSRPQSTRPGARPASTGRPGAGTPEAPKQRRGPSEEEIQAMRALPANEDTGVTADIDPDVAAAGRVTNETVTVLRGKFFVQDWKRKDGSYPAGAVPQIFLQLEVAREGDEPTDKPYKLDWAYGSPSIFVPSVDGQRVDVRKSAIREGAPAPTPQRKMAAVRFLKSLKEKGGAAIIDKLKKDGVTKALAGLRIHVSSQRTEDMHELAKSVILVDFIEGVSAPASPAKPAAPAAQAPAAQATTAAAAASSPVEELAEAAMFDVLAKAGGSVAIAQIATNIIQLDQWKSHDQRGAILKTLRDSAFFARRNGDLWTVEGNTIKSL